MIGIATKDKYIKNSFYKILEKFVSFDKKLVIDHLSGEKDNQKTQYLEFKDLLGTPILLCDEDYLYSLNEESSESSINITKESLKDMIDSRYFGYLGIIGTSNFALFHKPLILDNLLSWTLNAISSIITVDFQAKIFYDKRKNIAFNLFENSFLDFTEKEGEFLQYIFSNPKKSITLEEITKNIFHSSTEDFNKICDVYYEKIKKKFKNAKFECPIIRDNNTFSMKCIENT